MEFQEFVNNIARRGKKNFQVTNSFGVYDCYKYIRKNKWYNIGRPLTEHEFYTIIRSINNLQAEAIAKGETVYLPYSMGKIEVRKFERHVGIRDGKLFIGYPVDWNKTLRLWYEDEEAHKNKTLIRHEDKYTYKIKYDSYSAKYGNKIFYTFVVHNKLKKAFSKNVKKGVIDSVW